MSAEGLSAGAAAERARHPRRQVACVGLRDSSGRVLMVRTRKLPGAWQPVGGGTEPGETPRDAAVREVAEETGLHLVPAQLAALLVVPFDFGDGTVHFFLADVDPVALRLDPAEIVEHRWCTASEAAALPAFPATRAFVARLPEHRGA